MAVRVTVEYEDGHYAMHIAGDAPAKWLAENTIEISDQEWMAYQVHMQTDMLWHRRKQQLSNAIWQLTHE